MAAQRDVYVRMRMAFTFAVALLDFDSSGNASNRRCLPSFVAAVGQFRLMPQMWCALGADAWFENMSVYVNLRVGTSIDSLELQLPSDPPSIKLRLLCSLRVFYNLGRPSPALQHRLKHRKNQACSLKLDQGFAPPA